MCGILAIVADRTGGLPRDAADRATRALEAIAHRGPDARGLWVDPTNTVLLGHVRLSVIDVRAESNQPFWSECGNHGVVFNGEIYNFLEIRADLEKEGASFRTASDTEVLLQAIIRWGPDAIRRFNGMWAFAYVDLRDRSLLVSRDRFGVKPLYRHRGGQATVLASEAKAVSAWLGAPPEPDVRSIGLYLKYGIGGEHPDSWLTGVDRFPPAHFARIEWKSGQSRARAPERFWTYPERRRRMQLQDAMDELSAAVTDAVRIRLRSDVPLGLSLSGGLDSSAIAWLLRERFGVGVDAYSAWFEPREQSELGRAQATAARYGHRLHPVAEPSPQRTMDDLATCIWHLDCGHLSTAIVPYLNICRHARQSLTVMLEGQGADELLGGYAFLYPFASLDYLVQGSLGQLAATLRAETRAGNVRSTIGSMLSYGSRRYSERPFRRWAEGLLPRDIVDLEHPDPLHFTLSAGNLDGALRNEHTRRLRNLLQYGDALSMAVNLETRCPFMDYRVVELGFSMPTDLLIRDGAGKYVLRRLAQGHLPDEVVWPRRKDGFTNRTVARLREHVARQGVPPQAISDAASRGLLTHGDDTEQAICSLPDEAFYRVMSLLVWLDLRCGGRLPDRRYPTAP